MYFMPSDQEIKRVMDTFGFDRLTAIRHLQSQRQAQDQLARRGNPYPLGKSAYYA